MRKHRTYKTSAWIIAVLMLLGIGTVQALPMEGEDFVTLQGNRDYIFMDDPSNQDEEDYSEGFRSKGLLIAESEQVEEEDWTLG